MAALHEMGYSVSSRGASKYTHLGDNEARSWFIDELRSIPVVLVLCTGNWNKRPFGRGCCLPEHLPRCMDERMHDEVRQALHMNKLVVPVHVGTFDDEHTSTQIDAFANGMMGGLPADVQSLHPNGDLRSFPLSMKHFMPELTSLCDYIEEVAHHGELNGKTSFEGDLLPPPVYS